MNDQKSMSIICQKCKQSIVSKNDLIVMLQWWFIPRPLHKSCWGDLSMANKGVGSLSYQTGEFQGKKQKHLAINTIFYTILSLVVFLVGLYMLFANVNPTITSGDQIVVATSAQIIILKLIIFILCSVPLIQRVWSYAKIEKNLSN